MSSGVVPPHKSIQDHLQVCIKAAHHGQGLRKGYLIWHRHVRGIGQSMGPNPDRYALMLVNTGLQQLLRGRIVMSQAELVDPRTQVFPLVEGEAEG